jgi:aspartate kinase
VAGVASERAVLGLYSDQVAPDDLLAFLDEHKIGGKQLHVGEQHLALVLSRENLHQEDRLRADLAARFGDRVRLVDTHGAVSVVGAGINASFENVRRGTAVLAGEDIAVEGLSTSSFRVTWLIDRARLDDAVRLLHATFIEGQQPLLP